MIFFQDVKSRSVYWILFPVLVGLLLCLHAFQSEGVVGSWQAVVFNTAFFVGQLVLVTVWFSLRNRKWTNVAAELLGPGDVLFILCIAFYLSTFNFLFFYIASLIAVLLFWLVWQFTSKVKNKHVPLAGLQALLFAFFLLGDWWLKICSVTDDSWILNWIAR